MIKWLEKIALRIGLKNLRLASMTMGVLAALMAGAVCSSVLNDLPSDAVMLPFILIVLSVAVLHGFESANRKP
ncbi:hypothetical protein [Cohnella terricola]|uniref:Uncharacterized protein n=1 Tax=Cohnella terricola TaxID=1289167 RepID=A0A559JWS7_9BACL|nr:hypothetical protein [Cohnella terricola]TVY04336.1 hypothetical protein FPZ45_01705 [Cohnella terricola]